jgi:hypothetical protein
LIPKFSLHQFYAFKEEKKRRIKIYNLFLYISPQSWNITNNNMRSG